MLPAGVLTQGPSAIARGTMSRPRRASTLALGTALAIQPRAPEQ
jgi:hypothetical protein